MSRIFGTTKLILISNKIQRNYGSNRNIKTHYEVLRLSRDASKEDIRSAFIKLCKETHPDTSTKSNKRSHDEFVRISDAYNVLSKDSSRRQYDMNLKYRYNPKHATYRQSNHTYHHYYDPMRYGTYKDRFYREPGREHYQKMDPTYEYHGSITFLCLWICFFGGALQLAAISFRARRNHEMVMMHSERLCEEYAYIRSKAHPLE